MIEKIEGLVVSHTPYKESSLIIGIISKEYGFITLLANGAKKINNKFHKGTSLLTRAYFYTKYNSQKLSVISEIDIIDNYSQIKTDIYLFSYTSYLVNIVKQIIKENYETNIYHLLISAIDKINSNYNKEVIGQIMLIQLLKYLGIMPILDECVCCGNKNNIVTLSLDDCGIICGNCLEQQYIYEDKIIKLIRLFSIINLQTLEEIKISNNTIKTIESFVYEYYKKYSGIYVEKDKLMNVLNKL